MTAQTQIDFSIKARDEGMKRAIDHADRVTPNWSEQAYRFFKMFISRRSTPFMMEEFRASVDGVLPSPPHPRAFGAITMRAAKAGLIKQVGFAHVKNPKAHRANASVWLAV